MAPPNQLRESLIMENGRAAVSEDIPAVRPDNLQEAVVNVFRPIIHELDVCVEEARNSQQDVKRQIDILSDEIRDISAGCEVSPILEMYAKKMTTIKRRVTVMHNILQNVQDRLRKLEHSPAIRNSASAVLPPTVSVPVAPGSSQNV